MNGSWRLLDNYGYMVFTVPEDILNIFEATYEKIKDRALALPEHNHNLAGQIKEEHYLEHLIEEPQIRDYLNSVANNYVDVFNLPRSPDVLDEMDTIWDIQLKHMWMNVQKKHEYNPIHKHGGLLSFALWLKIPYDVDAELKLDNSAKSNLPRNGKFFFHYINSLGHISSAPPTDEEYKEGNLVIFPAKLHHSVNPFYTSDEDRVSISGNFYYTPKGTK